METRQEDKVMIGFPAGTIVQVYGIAAVLSDYNHPKGLEQEPFQFFQTAAEAKLEADYLESGWEDEDEECRRGVDRYVVRQCKAVVLRDQTLRVVKDYFVVKSTAAELTKARSEATAKFAASGLTEEDLAALGYKKT